MKPILFNTEMVRAILDGRKTVTRRVVKPQPEGEPYKMPDGSCWPGYFGTAESNRVFAPPYRPGDVLYVRETWLLFDKDHIIDGRRYAYRADCTPVSEQIRTEYNYKWHPSIHMPKDAARISLRVTDVRVERLQEIQERGPMSAEHEGFVNDIDLIDGGGKSATRYFADLWDSTIKKTDLDKYGWAANPFVWVIAFERVGKEEAQKKCVRFGLQSLGMKDYTRSAIWERLKGSKQAGHLGRATTQGQKEYYLSTSTTKDIKPYRYGSQIDEKIFSFIV